MIRWLRSHFPSAKPGPEAPFIPPAWQPPEATEAERAIVIAFQKASDRKARRDCVIRALESGLDTLLLPLGFQREEREWLKTVPKGRVVVQIKRFREGVDATLVVGFLPKPWARPREVSVDQLTMQLPNFVQMGERTFVRHGRIDYAIADHDLSVLEFPLSVLRDRALPWAMDLSGGRYPDWKPYRDRPLQSDQT